MNNELARCDREIAEFQQSSNEPAWLVAMAINDWELEKEAILKDKDKSVVEQARGVQGGEVEARRLHASASAGESTS